MTLHERIEAILTKHKDNLKGAASVICEMLEAALGESIEDDLERLDWFELYSKERYRMTLRKDIQAIITENKDDAESAAFLVCGMLDNVIGLEGNGWFEDDPEMLVFLENSWNSKLK